MKLRKQGHYVATPKFGLGFSLAEPFRISSKRSKEIASSQYTSVEEMKEVKGNKIKQRASVFDRIGGSTPSVSVFERLSHKGEHVASKHLKEVSTTSKTSVFCRLRTTRKSPSRKILSKYKEQVREERDHFEVVADKEICSAFPSRMKRKSILSISTDSPLKVQRRTIIYTCQPHKEANKEKEAMLTIQGSQREKSNFVETSYYITVEDSPCLNVGDEVNEAPPQLENGGQSSMDELKELNLGTPKDPRLTFISALLTPQEEEEYSKLLTEYKGVFTWSYKEMPGLSPKVVVHHLGIKSGAHPVKQSQHMFRPMLVSQIEVEVNKLIEEGFIRKVKYPSWISNIVPVKKKNGQIRTNPLKCAFGVTSGKFLGFIVRHCRIEFDPAKIDAIQKMPEPKNLRELRSLQRNLAFIRRFISNLVGQCQPFNHILTKDNPFQWDQSCQSAFESIKTYLLNPPVLGAPMLGKPLILYITAHKRSLGALLAQENEEGKEQAL
uniref:Uncharacterized protein LOC104217024 n=1 Tax=Nicotiana sylvestris TaxID=4096 RepID=A0A1U7VKK5_NICSY|nr:PREDICTED: uncharacterized protein LOC104217024 [Nicotiana sylvestris]